jgi:hypothetical protein
MKSHRDIGEHAKYTSKVVNELTKNFNEASDNEDDHPRDLRERRPTETK